MPSPFDSIQTGAPTPNVNDPNIPLVGQPYKLRGGMPTVLLQCNCEGHEPIMLTGIGAIGVCPSCGNGFRLDAVMFAPNGQLRAQVTTGRPNKPNMASPDETSTPDTP